MYAAVESPPHAPLLVRQGVILAPPAPGRLAARRPRPGAVPVTAALAVVVAIAYVGYQRIGTTANADVVEFTPNLAGGFLAVGMTEQEGGFVVLSELDRDEVDVHANLFRNALAGEFTVVRVTTPARTWRHRLRGPRAVLVGHDGDVTAIPVAWSHTDFTAIRSAIGCASANGTTSRRCGAPFADLHDLASDWPGDRVPDRVRSFLAAHGGAGHAHRATRPIAGTGRAGSRDRAASRG